MQQLIGMRAQAQLKCVLLRAYHWLESCKSEAVVCLKVQFHSFLLREKPGEEVFNLRDAMRGRGFTAMSSDNQV